MKKYGNHITNPMQSSIVKEKLKKNNLKVLGVENPMQSDKVKETQRENYKKKYNRDHPKQIHISDETWIKTNDPEWLKEQHQKFKKPCTQIAEELGDVGISYVCGQFHKHNIRIITYSQSIEENIIYLYIKNIYSKGVLVSSRAVISPLEIDIYLPDLNIAFEYNGEYWHKEGFMKPVGYHKNKTNLCRSKGIKLYHIWERHWGNNQEKMKQIIKRIIERELQVLKIN